MTPDEALERLREGNRRFVSGAVVRDTLFDPSRRADLVDGQQPFAIVLGCSDARVPVEAVFDQGPGDLFVIRVAGNVVAPSQLASIEFAADRFGTRLVVVLGHTSCGAVQATLDELRGPAAERRGSIASIVDRIRPAVEQLLLRDPGAGMRDAVRANVLASVGRIREGSPIVRDLSDREGMLVVGAEYVLGTGEVAFLHEA